MDAELESLLESLGPARRFADPAGPLPARQMAAGGALPLPAPQVAAVLVALTRDSEAAVADKARESLGNLPDGVVDGVLGGESHPCVLAWFAETSRENEARLEKIALNAVTSDETYCLLATLPLPRIVDIVSSNQVRLLRCPALVEALGDNPATPQSTIDRILHFLGVENRDVETAPVEDENAPEAPPPADAEENAEAAVDLEDASDLPPELVEESEDDAKLSDEEEEEKTDSLLSQIAEMNVMEKVKLARFGNGDARSILIRDRNKIVASAAIMSPKIKENEVVAFAKSRNLCDDVYRIISNNRSWTKSYQVKLALATNPKTATSTAMKFLNYLTDRDLRTLMRSRDVPAPVSQQARRILVKKGKA